MNLTREQLDSLLGMLARTRPDELTCDDCAMIIAQFAEANLAGKTIPEVQQAIEYHLEMCGECREEFEALLAALKE